VPLRVVVAEDNLLVREGVIRLLQADPDVQVIAACQDYDGLIATVTGEEPDVLVTDIRMPPGQRDEGIRAAVELRSRQPGTGVVVLSQYPNPAYLQRLLAEGSDGRAYLLKERVSEGSELVDAVHKVAQGGSVIDSVVVESLMAATTARKRGELDRLTARETEVLAAMARGRSNAAVSADLFITQRAVEKHVNAIFAKLGLTEEQEVSRRVMAVLLYLTEQAPPG
jgi:DNA-binding NarL/FixJ family response regulator